MISISNICQCLVPRFPFVEAAAAAALERIDSPVTRDTVAVQRETFIYIYIKKKKSTLEEK